MTDKAVAGLNDLKQRLEQVDRDVVSAAALQQIRRAQKLLARRHPLHPPEDRESILRDIVRGVARAASVMARDAGDRGRRAQWKLVVRAARKLERLLDPEREVTAVPDSLPIGARSRRAHRHAQAMP